MNAKLSHINHAISRVKESVESINVTGKTVTVILDNDAATSTLAAFLKLTESKSNPGNHEGANGENYWYILGPETVVKA